MWNTSRRYRIFFGSYVTAIRVENNNDDSERSAEKESNTQRQAHRRDNTITMLLLQKRKSFEI